MELSNFLDTGTTAEPSATGTVLEVGSIPGMKGIQIIISLYAYINNS